MKIEHMRDPHVPAGYIPGLGACVGKQRSRLPVVGVILGNRFQQAQSKTCISALDCILAEKLREDRIAWEILEQKLVDDE
jgi:hypothetical protein